MIEDLHILSVGPACLCDILGDALRDFPHCRFSVAEDFRKLWLTPRNEVVDVAVLHCTLSALDLEDSGRFIRRHWPGAQILVLRADSAPLDDALYDERLPPTEPPSALRLAIERLTGRIRKGKIA